MPSHINLRKLRGAVLGTPPYVAAPRLSCRGIYSKQVTLSTKEFETKVFCHDPQGLGSSRPLLELLTALPRHLLERRHRLRPRLHPHRHRSDFERLRRLRQGQSDPRVAVTVCRSRGLPRTWTRHSRVPRSELNRPVASADRHQR